MIARPQTDIDAEARANNDPVIRYVRLGFTMLLVPLSWHAFHSEYGWIPLLSDIDTAVHEFGHMLFMPFGIQFLGTTMVVLGGSLFQVVFPLIFTSYFALSRKHRDVHAALLCLWWSSLNVLSVAIYCADARAGQLMLLSGETGEESGGEGHDWHMLLDHWGALKRDTAIAGTMRRIAVLVCVFSIIAGAVIAWKQAQLRAPAKNQRTI
ncbi:MAG TPA: hypothetical protein VE967_11235 [Gemmatimonadaceae bacterium]|nr:hypothetical protein [Gemmatimonadaceae bacterium]